MTKLSATARVILTVAADRADRVASPPDRLPAAARRAVVQSMLKAGLIQEVAAGDDQLAWRTTESGERFVSTAIEFWSNVGVENSPLQFDLVAPVAAGRLNGGEFAEVEFDHVLERLCRGSLAEAVG